MEPNVMMPIRAAKIVQPTSIQCSPYVEEARYSATKQYGRKPGETEDRASTMPVGEFAHQHAPPVRQLELARGERADDQ